MPRSLFVVALAAAVSLTVCGFRPAPADGGGSGGGSGGGGDGGRPGAGFVGTWVGTPAIVELDGFRLTPEMQAQLQAPPLAMEFTFAGGGAVTMTVGGRAMTYTKAGDFVVGGDPLNGVASAYEVKSLTATGNRIELQLWSRCGATTQNPRDPALRDDTQLSTWTFTLAGDRIDMRCNFNQQSNVSGKRSSGVMAATLTRAGGW
jgi:hypothetical protein